MRSLVALTAILASCAMYEPDVGPPLAGACDNEDTDPGAEVSFALHVRPLLVRMDSGCGCHMPSGGGIGIQLSGLDLGSMYALRRGGTSSGTGIVVEREPCASVLYQKLTDTPPFGSRMPVGTPAYTTAEIALLHDWIAEGALDN